MHDPAYVQYKHKTFIHNTCVELKIGSVTLIRAHTQLVCSDNYLYNPQFHTDPFSGSTAVTYT
jgi:hypothetical protein